jgi:aldehyde:ferredoxin oxidoreductase
MAWCLGTATSTRGGGHTTGTPNCEQSGLPIDDKMALKIMGVTGEVAVNMGGYEGKAKMVYYHEILHRICNSTGVCIFNTIHMDMNFVNIDDLVVLLSAATGRDFNPAKLEEITMRILNTEKALNLRFTNFARADDFPPQREMEEPIPTGPRKGFKIDNDKYNGMLDDYYDLHEWEKKSSYPTRAVYEKYGLRNIADDMEKIGKLGV